MLWVKSEKYSDRAAKLQEKSYHAQLLPSGQHIRLVEAQTPKKQSSQSADSFAVVPVPHPAKTLIFSSHSVQVHPSSEGAAVATEKTPRRTSRSGKRRML